MTVVIRCRTCGQEYEPTKADLTAGPSIYHWCYACRPKPRDGQPSRRKGREQ